MQRITYAPRFDRTFSPTRGRRNVIGLVAVALLLTLPLAARGQGTGATGGGAPATNTTQPPAANPALPTPSASPAPSSAPASSAAPAAAPPPSATPAPAAAALPGERMISSAELPEDLSSHVSFVQCFVSSHDHGTCTRLASCSDLVSTPPPK
jgi:hypothetical protein